MRALILLAFCLSLQAQVVTTFVSKIATGGGGGGETPDNFYATNTLTGLVYAMEADYGSGAGGVNDTAISAMTNSGGSGTIVATQGTSAKQPKYKTNVQNGKPAIYFDAGDCLVVPAIDLTGTDAVTVFVVSNHSVDGATHMLYEFADTSFDTGGFFTGFAVLRNSSNKLEAGSKGDTGYNMDTSTTSASSTFIIWTAVIDKGLSVFNETTIKYNNVTEGGGGSQNENTNAYGNHPSYIGSRNNAASLGLNGHIAAILVFNDALSAGDQTIVYNYLKAKYGL
jgi:hypothetical protein